MHAVRWSSAHEGTSGRLCHPERSEGSRWGMARASRTRSLAPLGMTKAATGSARDAPLDPPKEPHLPLGAGERLRKRLDILAARGGIDGRQNRFRVVLQQIDRLEVRRGSIPDQAIGARGDR